MAGNWAWRRTLPVREYCSKCGKVYNPNEQTVDARLLQAIFGEHLCPHCYAHRDAQICVKCNKEVLAPVYFDKEPYHSKCLAEVMGQ